MEFLVPLLIVLVIVVAVGAAARYFGRRGRAGQDATAPDSGPVKAGRRGLLMNPGDLEGDTLMSTPLGRIYNNKFIPGRGYIVGRGKAFKLQVATTMDHER